MYGTLNVEWRFQENPAPNTVPVKLTRVINKTELTVSRQVIGSRRLSVCSRHGPLEETSMPTATVMAADQYVGRRALSAGPTQSNSRA